MNNHLVMIGILFRIWQGKFSTLKCEYCGEKIDFFGHWRYVDKDIRVHSKCYNNYIKEHPIIEEKEKTDTETHNGLIWFGIIVIILGFCLGLIIGGVFCILGGLILGIVLIAVGLNKQSRREETKILVDAISKSPTSKETPLEILKMRYAKGEITKEDFEQMKKDLE